MARKPLQRGNGQGSVHKLSGRRSRPWRAVVTKGWSIENGKSKQIRECIGYYATRDMAMEALLNYNANPYDISAGKATFEEVFDKWSAQKFPTVSHSNQVGYTAAYKRCDSISNKPFKDIKLDDLQFCIDTCGANYPTLKKIKILFNQLYKYALARDMVDKDYSKYVDIKKYADKNPNKFDRNAFSESEIQKFWSVKETEIGKIMLMLIYSGLRISELLNLKKSDCYIAERYIDITKAKTAAGKRQVPIAEKTLDFWLHFYNKPDTESGYLIIMDGRSFEGTAQEPGYRSFRDTYFLPLVASLDMEGRQIHETRHTCVTLLESKDVSQPKIHRIIGHTGKTTAENVYMHLSIDDLIEAINLI